MASARLIGVANVLSQATIKQFLKQSVFRDLLSIRNMSTSESEMTLREMFKPRECRFRTPCGHIAGLEWGHQDAPKKVLCMHGMLNNAASFERLIPFILNHDNNNKKYHVVSLDMPGVGFSSHYPPGPGYHQFSVIADMKRVIQQLNWERVTLLCHSLGANLSFYFSCIYPHYVQSFVSIDESQPTTNEVDNWNVNLGKYIDGLISSSRIHEEDSESNTKVPVYSKEDALERLIESHNGSLTRESAEVLLKRSIKKYGWGYTFTRDLRCRHLSADFRLTDELMLDYLKETFKPPLLVIRATKTHYRRTEEMTSRYYEIYRRNCPLFIDVLLEGTHHLHLNTPDIVANEINKFFDQVN